MQTILDGLNDIQIGAVTHTQGPLLVLAGAGSGKTRVITCRIAYLIDQRLARPWNILAITFTNKAAQEMRERLTSIVGEAANDMCIRTFHSTCVRILRRDIERIGYKQGFVIYDSDDQKRLIKECLKQLNIDDKLCPVSACVGHISRAKDEFLEPKEFLEAHRGNLKMMAVGRVYELYKSRMKANNCLDFDDLIVLTVRLFESCPDILEYYQDKFRYIHIDEYQDTNNAQYSFTSLLAKKYRNLCVVGDDDQSIYKFRGANIGNILDFEATFPEAKVIRLEQNYRSTTMILNAANDVIKNNMGRKGKTLWTDCGEGDKIVNYRALDERDEAAFIADEIRRLRLSGQSYSDIAILYRMNAQARAVEECLISSAIPYRIVAGHRFYDSKEIKDIIAYLRVIQNPSDDISLARIINEPKRKIGSTTVQKAAALAVEQGISLYEFLRDGSALLERAAGSVDAFMKIMEGLRAVVSNMTVPAFISEVLDKTGYAAQYSINPDDMTALGRLENLKEFVSVGVNYEKEAEEPSLGDFLDNVSLVSDIDNYDEEQDCVCLMTLHSSKGLEFPVVFVTGLEEGVFPGSRAMFDSEEVEEERRLCYVGITRAKKQLYITHAQTRMMFGSTTRNRVSRFVEEINKELCDDKFSLMISKPAKKTSQSEKRHIEFQTWKEPAPPKRSSAPCDLQTGDRVGHKKFGEGTVATAVPVGNDTKLEIIFDTVGKKTLLAVYANLIKI